MSSSFIRGLAVVCRTRMNMNERKIDEVVRKVNALRQIKTMNTTRAQNIALQTLNDAELAEAAVRLTEAE